MSQLSTEVSQPEPFTPVGPMPEWTQTMRRATQAQHTGQWVLALAQFQMALAQARALLCWHPGGEKGTATVDDAQADARVCAFVSSHRCLADLQTEGGSPELAASTLAQAHTTMLSLLQAHPSAGAWHRAAAWHSRDTHAALMAHWADHGPHPHIDRALRAGCLALTAGAADRNQLH